MERIRIGISACLLGEKVRYDGTHSHDRYITETLGKYFEWVPVCPEVEYGLPVPREAMRLTGDREAPRLVTRKTGVDHTEGMERWARKRLDELAAADLCGFIFKKGSPSSGVFFVKIYGPTSARRYTGAGIFGGAFMRLFPLIPVEEDGRLNDPAIRENFIERVFTLKRWKNFLAGGSRRGDLVGFHTAHKLLLMAHSPTLYTRLGRLVAGSTETDRKDVNDRYATLLMEGCRLLATTRKNTNVLQHMAGYFKKLLVPDEKKELLEVIDSYRRGLVPLAVPVTLIKHYTRKFDIEYLKGQVYLNPFPAELMLKNHG